MGEMVKIFPDPYWHIGGDENNGKQWAANPKIQAFMKEKQIKDAHGLPDGNIFRMQSAAPELIDLSGETKQTLEAYGVGRQDMEIAGPHRGGGDLAARMRDRDVGG